MIKCDCGSYSNNTFCGCVDYLRYLDHDGRIDEIVYSINIDENEVWYMVRHAEDPCPTALYLVRESDLNGTD